MHVSIKPDAKELLKVAIFHPVSFRITFFYATKAVIQNVEHNTGRFLFTQFLFVWFCCHTTWKFTPLFKFTQYC